MPADDTQEPAPEPHQHDLNPEELQVAMREANERLAQQPAAQIVVTHAVGLYQLAAIHLSAQPPHLGEASLAIDAMACLVEGLAGRLGEEEATLADALSNIRFAYFQIKAAQPG